jgi:hypothetical protein
MPVYDFAFLGGFDGFSSEEEGKVLSKSKRCFKLCHTFLHRALFLSAQQDGCEIADGICHPRVKLTPTELIDRIRQEISDILGFSRAWSGASGARTAAMRVR